MSLETHFLIANQVWMNQSSSTVQATFHYIEDLPFPLSMPYHWRVFFSAYLIFIIFGGLACRKIILQYLTAPETKSNPINSLIWFDQLSGVIFGTFNLIFASTVLILKDSLRSFLGTDFCNWVPLAGCINLTGYFVWSSLIAIYRTLYIKAQKWVKFGIGEKRLLAYFIMIGLLVQILLSAIIFYFDDESLVSKACNHFSAEDLDVLQQFKVSGTQ